METLPAVRQQSMFFNVERFELAQRVAKVFAESTMVPDQFKKNLGNCIIALNYADRIGADPFMVMQNMYVIGGKPGIESKLAIALLNTSGKFSPLQFRYNKSKTECTAYSKNLKSSEALEGVTVSMEMAQKEGWSGKNGSKWKTMPEMMLMYRAAIFFIRMYAPEVLLGMFAREELEDITEMKQVSGGKYAYEDQADVPTATFEELAANFNGDLENLEAFVSITAEKNGMEPATMKEAAAKDFDNFLRAYAAWKEKNKPAEKPIDKPEFAKAPCPNMDGEVIPRTEECEVCDKRDGCPAWC